MFLPFVGQTQKLIDALRGWWLSNSMSAVAGPRIRVRPLKTSAQGGDHCGSDENNPGRVPGSIPMSYVLIPPRRLRLKKSGGTSQPKKVGSRDKNRKRKRIQSRAARAKCHLGTKQLERTTRQLMTCVTVG